MRIDEVIRGLHQFIARVRVNGLVCDVGIQSATVQQARTLLGEWVGAQNIISCVAVLDESDQPDKPMKSEPIKPVGPKPSVMKTIKPKPSLLKKTKPLSGHAYNKQATTALNKWVKKKARVTKAQKKIQTDFAKLADINRGPA
jgi:hypothetical protein